MYVYVHECASAYVNMVRVGMWLQVLMYTHACSGPRTTLGTSGTKCLPLITLHMVIALRFWALKVRSL